MWVSIGGYMAYQDIEKRIRECKKCGKIKPFNEFIKEKRCNHGIKWTCNSCRSKRRRESTYLKNKEQIDELNTLNSQKLRKCKKCNTIKPFEDFTINYNCDYNITHICKVCNNSYVSKRNKKYPELRRNRNAEYRKNNLEKVRKWKRESEERNRDKMNKRRKELYRNDEHFRMGHLLRGRLRDLIKNRETVKPETAPKLIGCTIEIFINHIESLFTEGMTWDKFGFKGIHIDHIKPCSAFDLSDPEQQKECFYYTNLQPLWAEDNLSKSTKLNWRKP